MLDVGKTYKYAKYIGIFFLIGVALGGCMSLPDLKGPFKMFAAKEKPATIIVKKETPAPPITIAETTGMPPGWSARLHSHLTSEAQKKSVILTQSLSEHNDLKLVGHLSAADVREGTLVAYVWDVKNKKGENIHRISGQKKIERKGPRGAWSAINDETLRSVGEEAATNLQTWLTAKGFVLQPDQIAQSTESENNGNSRIEAQTPRIQRISAEIPENKPLASPRIKNTKKQPKKDIKVAALDASPLPAPKKETGFKKAQNAAKKKEAKKTPSSPKVQKTAPPSVSKHSTSFVYVSSVNGARGQGNSELTRAIISSLAKNGLGISPAPGPAGYKLEGKVKIEPSDEGKDKVFLSWKIKTSDGMLIGTVSQKNKIQAGSFDKTWGQTAFFAADAAAGSIKTVIDKQQRQKVGNLPHHHLSYVSLMY